MFGRRWFGGAYWGASYFGDGGDIVVADTRAARRFKAISRATRFAVRPTARFTTRLQ